MKPLFYHIILMLFLLTCSTGLAQQKLYSFSLKETGQFLTCSQGSLVMANARAGINKMAQRFIVKRLNSGKTLIASAAKPTLFLKRDGLGITLAAYSGGDASFEWHLHYSGYPYTSIAEPGTANVLNWQAGSGLTMENIAVGLTHNDDSAGDHYRFEISNQTNTF